MHLSHYLMTSTNGKLRMMRLDLWALMENSAAALLKVILELKCRM